MEFTKSESGQVLVLTAVCMLLLAGFPGRTIDVGLLYHTSHNVQIAADAAAIATTVEYRGANSKSSAKSAGHAAATATGFTKGTNGAVVTVNLPPAPFMGLFAYASPTVEARAVAGMTSPENACIWLLASTGKGLDLQRSYSISAPNCGVDINASDTAKIEVEG
jgi:Flp pilus assembly protein TadG